MNALVLGGGSIGKRHLQNLKSLDVDGLALVETDDETRLAVSEELGIAGFATLAEGLDWSPDFVVVSTPTHLHIQHALEVVSHDCNVFVEKPLSHTPEGLAELCDFVERKKLVSLVGCNMRFHPGPLKIKELIRENFLGRILFARIHAGSYLPGWRKVDYRDNYAAREETGGGCILDCIHEIDLAQWYLGDVREVFCYAGHLSSLEIYTEDVAFLFCRHLNSAVSEIHLDYVQRTYERGCQIVGEQGSIFWDFSSGEVRWYDAVGDQWTSFRQPDGWKLNQMYLEEMQHFIDCVRTRQSTVLPIPNALGLMRIVFAAKTSARKGRLVATEDVTPA